MNKKLEKVLELLINEEHEKAREVFHEVVIESAREILQDLITEDEELEDIEEKDLMLDGMDLEEGDDGLDGDDIEAIEKEIQQEEYFGEEDDLDVDQDAMEDSESGNPPESEEHDMDEKLDNISDLLSRLQAELEELKGEESEEDEEVEDEEEMEDEEDEEVEDEEEMEDEEDEEIQKESSEFDDLDEEFELDEDFHDLEESANDYLSTVSVKSEDGKEVGAGRVVDVNKDSPVVSKKATERTGAGPKGYGKSDDHKGFAMENPPASKELPRMVNNTSAVSGYMDQISKEGNKDAALNSRAGFGAEQTKSPIGS